MAELATAEFWQAGIDKAAREATARASAFAHWSQRGGYPIAQERADATWEEISAYLNETVIQRALQHDLRLGSRGPTPLPRRAVIAAPPYLTLTRERVHAGQHAPSVGKPALFP